MLLSICSVSALAQTPVNIQIGGGVNRSVAFLSVTDDGSKSDLFSTDDASGRQRWSLRPGPDHRWYNIVVEGGINNERKFLSVTSDGTRVDLFPSDDGSGRQRWVIEKLPGGLAHIRNFAGVEGSRKYLSVNSDGSLIDLFPIDDNSGRQRWKLSQLDQHAAPIVRTVETKRATPTPAEPTASVHKIPDTPSFQPVNNARGENPYKELPEASYPPPPTPAWHADSSSPPGPDLNGVWEWNANNNIARRLRLIQLRNRFWGANDRDMPFLAPGQKAIEGAYVDPHSNKANFTVLADGKLALRATNIIISDANDITIGGKAFHRVSTRPIRDIPCNPRELNRIEALEALARGEIYYALGDLPTANCWFYVSASEGNAFAQASYGTALLMGRGIAQDKPQAFRWFQLSAMQNNFFGISNLGLMIAEGEVVPRSLERATYWEQRARVNDPSMVHDGINNLPPPDKKWLMQTSPECNDAASAKANGDLALGYGIAAFQALSFSRAACWFNASERQGNLHAAAYLGILHVFGWGMRPNPKTGFDYMKKAADGGDWFGVSYLAEFYRRGIGTPVDLQKGRQLWDKATSDSPGGTHGGWAAYAIVSGTMLTSTQGREFRNGLLASLLTPGCTEPTEQEKRRLQALGEPIPSCDNSPKRKEQQAVFDGLTKDTGIKPTLDYPEEISPEYVAPGNPLSF